MRAGVTKVCKLRQVEYAETAFIQPFHCNLNNTGPTQIYSLQSISILLEKVFTFGLLGLI